MKSRIITGVVGSVLALVVLLLLPPIALNIAVAAVCGLAMNEMLIVTRFVGHRGLMAAGVTFSVAAPFLLLLNTTIPCRSNEPVSCFLFRSSSR